jgi:hypothetical protein
MVDVPAGNTRSADRSASSIISAKTFAKMPEYGMATARMPVVADRPAIWINSNAQNISCTERRNAQSSLTARNRANTSASRNPVLAPIATPSTANATVHTTLIISREKKSGRIRPAARRRISAHGLSALTARSDTTSATAAISRNSQLTDR